MKDYLVKLSVQWNLLKDEKVQDMVEYALIFAVIALTVTAAVKMLAVDHRLFTWMHACFFPSSFRF